MQALLTGGAGFIGSHLSHQLLSLGFNVTCLDNFSTGSRANISDLLNHDNFSLVVGNAEDEGLITPLIERADIIFHLAASVGVKTIVNNPINSIENNLFCTSLILKLASRGKKRTFIFSTSEVYGKSTKFPFAESDDLVLGPAHKPRWSYASAKLVDDFLALSYYNATQLPVTVVRLFNTVGVGQVGHYGMVVPRFMDQALRGEPLTIYGDGSQSRCFTDVRDVTTIITKLIDCDRAIGEVVNIGNNDEISILNLAKKVKQLTNSSSDFLFVPFEVAYGPQFEDMERRVPCQKKLLGMIRHTFAYNVEDTLVWMRNKSNVNRSQSRNATDVWMTSAI